MSLSVNHPAARKLYAFDLSKSITQDTFFYKSGLIQKANSKEAKGAVIVQMDELSVPQRKNGKASGFQVEYDLEGPIFIYPTSGGNPIKGKEAKLKLYTDTIQINQDRVSVIDDGKFADGLVPYEFRDRVKDRLSTQQWPLYYDERFVIKMSGSLGGGTWQTVDVTQPTASARDKDGSVAADGNDLRAPSSNRVLYGNAQANQAAITTADTLSLDVMDQAIMLAVRPAKNTTNNRTVPRLMIGGKPALVMLCDYVTLQSMNANTSGRFYDIQRAKIQGGMKDSALLDFAEFYYRSPMGVDVYIVPHPNLVKFTAAQTGGVQVVRNLLLGHSACRLATGREAKELPLYDWHEETDNRGDSLVVTSGTTVGIQKCAFTTTELGSVTEDWSTIAVDTYGVWQ